MIRREGGGRDPRDTDSAWCRAQCFVVLLPDGFDVTAVRADDDAEAAAWFPRSALPDTLAFDHDRLIADALALLDGEA